MSAYPRSLPRTLARTNAYALTLEILCTYIYTNALTYAHVGIHPRTYVYVCAYVCGVRAHAHTHMYKHTRTHKSNTPTKLIYIYDNKLLPYLIKVSDISLYITVVANYESSHARWLLETHYISRKKTRSSGFHVVNNRLTRSTLISSVTVHIYYCHAKVHQPLNATRHWGRESDRVHTRNTYRHTSDLVWQWLVDKLHAIRHPTGGDVSCWLYW